MKIPQIELPLKFRERFILFGNELYLFVAKTGTNPDQAEIYFNPQFLGEEKSGEKRFTIWINTSEETQGFHFHLPNQSTTVYEHGGKKYRITLVEMDRLIPSKEPFPIFEVETVE